MKHVELHDVELGHTAPSAQSNTKRPSVSYEDRYDLVLVFPRPVDDKQGKASQFTQDRFVDDMLGLRRVDGSEFMSSANRVLKTTRCFLKDDGTPDTEISDNDPDRHGASSTTSADRTEDNEKMALALRERMKEMLREEWREHMRQTGGDGSSLDAATTRSRYAELVAKTIVRRLQLACGLTTHMFFSVDKDEIICTVKADAQDLMTEADRVDYHLQTLNCPFGQVKPSGAAELEHERHISAVTAAFMHKQSVRAKGSDGGPPGKKSDGTGSVKQRQRRASAVGGTTAVQEARKHLYATCGGPRAPAPPTMDPTLYINRMHPHLEYAVRKMGHREEHASSDGGNNVYLAPYVAFRSDDAKFRPLFRRYSVDDEIADPGAGMFQQIDRTRLVGSIIARHINLPSLDQLRALNGYFAPHTTDELEWLENNWALDFKIWHQLRQPLGRIRNYFGEKIATYFAWLEFYTRALIVPAIFGLVVQCVNFAEGKSPSVLLIIYGATISLWSSVFCEFWNRRNSFLNLWWGTYNYRDQEQERPAFRGIARRSPVDDEFEVAHVTPYFYYAKIGAGASVVFTMICAVISAIGGIFYYKQQLINDPRYGPKKGSQIAGIMNGAQIQVMNVIYRSVAIKLNDWENHRTDTEYENNLVLKTFLFQFVNSYASFFYIAFIKRYFEQIPASIVSQRVEDFLVFSGANATAAAVAAFDSSDFATNPCTVNPSTGLPDCLFELQIQLALIFGTRLVIGNTMELGVPFLKHKFRVWQEKRAADGVSGAVQYSQPEAEAKLNPYEEMQSFDDYAEMVLQYGFVTLFVVAFPAAPFLALVNNVVEVHIDAFKLCNGHRRPWPKSASSIGTWQYFLSLMSSLSVVTNTALILFTTDIPELPQSIGGKWLAFMACEHILLLAKKMIEDFVPDERHWVSVLRRRHEWLQNKVFRGLQHDDDDDLQERAEALNLEIHANLAGSGGGQQAVVMPADPYVEFPVTSSNSTGSFRHRTSGQKESQRNEVV